jgi:hypothetical protein
VSELSLHNGTVFTLLFHALVAQIVETAYQQTKNFDKLSFLHLAGSTEKLSKMQNIENVRGDPISRFHNAPYAGDVLGRFAILGDVGMRESFPLVGIHWALMSCSFYILRRTPP